MRVLHIQQYFNEGMGYQENILPYYQQKLGHDVVLVTSNRSNGFAGQSRIQEEKEFIENEFKVNRIGIKGEFKGRFVIFNDLYSYIEKEKPDYIFHHSVTSPSLWTIVKYKKNNPHVFIATDNHADLNISGKNKIWKKVYYNIYWNNFLKICDPFIDVYFGVTPSRCLFLNEELGIDNSKIRLLPIGADVDNSKVNISKESFLLKYKIGDGNLIITHGGKITPEKQVDRLIIAFKQLTNPDVRLVLFGDILDVKVEELIKSDNRIIYLGWLDRTDTLSVLKYSDIGIWNTQHTTLLEDCIAVELPLILRYYGSTCHLIDRTGIFLYEGSVREIYDKLLFLINNRNILKEFKKNAVYLKEELSYDMIAKESIAYSQDLKFKHTHRKFMTDKFSDKLYKYFRVFNRD
ncbi:glycosyltransferase family 4 protein [Exiguobacterium sp. s157]|uniref:glycosyltransferase family 4 protein n=1 Tax=Exiguobacterium sp. s157 TaxID=2751233 RepID=UPI001BE793A1|nr:glycosyltransferase family 4 protein [Exiguobacterium sp. s157]